MLPMPLVLCGSGHLDGWWNSKAKCVEPGQSVGKLAVLDKIIMLNQVEKKALSLEKAHIDGATVTCLAMYV